MEAVEGGVVPLDGEISEANKALEEADGRECADVDPHSLCNPGQTRWDIRDMTRDARVLEVDTREWVDDGLYRLRRNHSLRIEHFLPFEETLDLVLHTEVADDQGDHHLRVVERVHLISSWHVEIPCH